MTKRKNKSLFTILLILLPLLYLVWKVFTPDTNKTQYPNYNNKQEAIKKIVASAISGKEINKETHQKYWFIIDEYLITKDEQKEIFDLIENPSLLEMHRSFYQDLVSSIDSQSIVLSNKRRDLEAKLLDNNEIERNEYIIEKSIKGQPVTVKGITRNYSKKNCFIVLESLDSIFRIAKINSSILQDPNYFNQN